MAVGFGESLYDVERRYPGGYPQTSPYGAPAYKLENVSSGSVDYRDVIYEFTDTSGMQMAMAHFSPSSTADVFKELQSSLGQPSSASGSNSSDPSLLEASWRLPDGGSVSFNGPAHRLTLVGRDGAALQTDVRLRDTDVPAGAP